MSVHRPTRQLSPIARALTVGAGVAVRIGDGLGVGVGLAVCGVIALGSAESARPTGAGGVAAPPHAVSMPRIAAPATALRILRVRICSGVVRLFINRLSLRDPTLRYKGGRLRARSNWVDVCGRVTRRAESPSHGGGIALAWERRQAHDAASQEWDRGESRDDGAGGHRGHETNAFAERCLEHGRREAPRERAQRDTGGRERARDGDDASLLIPSDDALTERDDIHVPHRRHEARDDRGDAEHYQRSHEEAERRDRPREALDRGRQREGGSDAEPRTHGAGERGADHACEPADREDPPRAVRPKRKYAICDEQERGAYGHVPHIRDHHTSCERDERGVAAPEDEARSDIADRVRPHNARRVIGDRDEAHHQRRPEIRDGVADDRGKATDDADELAREGRPGEVRRGLARLEPGVRTEQFFFADQLRYRGLVRRVQECGRAADDESDQGQLSQRHKSEGADQGDCREGGGAQDVHDEEHRAAGDAIDQRRGEDSDGGVGRERARGEHADVEWCGVKLKDRQRRDSEGGELRTNGTDALAEPKPIEVAAQPDAWARALHYRCERRTTEEHSGSLRVGCGQIARAVGDLSCRQARSPATPTSGITAETTKTAPNPDTATICPERNEPVITPKSVKAQNVAIAVPRSAAPARSIASAWSAGWAVAKPMPTATPARRDASARAGRGTLYIPTAVTIMPGAIAANRPRRAAILPVSRRATIDEIPTAVK